MCTVCVSQDTNGCLREEVVGALPEVPLDTHSQMLVTAYVLVNVGREANGTGAIAKWLQRQIRNLFLFEGAGSNPAGVARHFYVF